MFGWFRRRTDDGTIKAFIEALQPIQVSAEGPYTAMDRYRDFHNVFNTDIGKRVLSQIVDKCEGKLPAATDSPQVLAAYVERRKLGLWIAAITTVPPRQTE